MPFLEELGLHAISNSAMAITGPAIAIAGGLLGGGPSRSALIGAGIGALSGVLSNNSYSSTDVLSNALIGATLGAMGGGLSKFILPRTPELIGSGMKSLFKNRAAVARGSVNLGKGIGRTSINATKFALNHPILTGGVLAGGYMGVSLSTRNTQMMDIDLSGAEEINNKSWRSFQDSSTGLSLGLHARRHK